MSPKVELQPGQRFGMLTVICEDGRIKHEVGWKCMCDCGRVKTITYHQLASGETKSCGCYGRSLLGKFNTTHGGSRVGKTERLYGVWKNMKTRCYNKHYHGYDRYGGRGIKVCDEWRTDYSAFREWAFDNGYDENAPHGKCTLDRIDVNRDYCPENCRFVDMREQTNNRSVTTLFEYDGCRRNINEIAELAGVNKWSLRQRVFDYGDSVESAIASLPKYPKK